MSIATTASKVWALDLKLQEMLEKCQKKKKRDQARKRAEKRRTKIYRTIWMPLAGQVWFYGEGAGGADENTTSRWGGVR